MQSTNKSKPKLIGIITEENVGTSFCTPIAPHYKNYSYVGFIGGIQKLDIGKHVYLNGDVVQVENEAQRDARVKGKAGDITIAKALVDTLMQDLENHLLSVGVKDNPAVQQDLREIRAKLYSVLINGSFLK